MDKHAMVEAVVNDLIKHGGKGYRSLIDDPVVFVKNGRTEYLIRGNKKVDVTGKTLTSILSTVSWMAS